ncbi:ABC transporter permease [Corynebacterium sp. TA-R-1]|uniref:ABC transporter permease n=1 Tax=Corynebacterium stercoris TaxID=2943490 RepID=A0ABT1G2Y1_9CORY|nr:ABC transporter permease [Corynebacterium stercoris]MCP1388388.1 ABC transporter permease [Corynebacterium stercoris]
MAQETYSPWHTVRTTALREMQIISRSRAVIFTLVILIVATLGMIGFFTWQANKDDAAAAGDSVAVVGVDTQSLSAAGLDPQGAADRAEAERLVRDGDVKAAVVADGTTWDVISDGFPSGSVMDAVEAVAQAQSQAEALQNLGIDPAEYAAAAPQIQVNAVDVDGDEGAEEQFIRQLTAFISLMVMIFTVITFAAQVGSRVTEEKSSRVVELVLASVRPMDFLAGKILGNLAYGFIATAVILGAGALGLNFSGLLDGVPFDWSILPIMLIAWLLGMLFFSALYAAAGAMVQRTEDLQSTQMPILLLIMASAYVPAFGWTSTSETWMQVCSWIPPLSIFAAPLTWAAGDLTSLQLGLSFLLSLAATVLVVWLAARIYRRSILNNGRVTKWSEALKGARA